jgi:hypothetical protein
MSGRAMRTFGIKQSTRLSLFQEARFGKEKMELVKILQHHHVVIRGSNEEGQQIVDALLVSNAFCSR